MGLFKKIKESKIAKAAGGGIVDILKQIPGIGRFVTILFDRGESGKFSLKDFKWRDLWAVAGGAVVIYGLHAGWWGLEQLTDFVTAIAELFASVFS